MKSVPGQPLAAPDSRPMHQVALALLAFEVARVWRSVHVFGAPAERSSGLGVVPDQTLDGGLDEDAVDAAVDHAEANETRRVVGLVGRRVDHVVELDELAGCLVLGHLPGAGQAGQVWQVARLDALGELRVDVASARVLDLDACLVDPWLDHRQERGLLSARPRSHDGQRSADGSRRGSHGRGRARGARYDRSRRRGHGRRGGASSSTPTRRPPPRPATPAIGVAWPKLP